MTKLFSFSKRLVYLSKKFYSNEEKKNSLEKLRNIGIIAHVDAGKTTTTERILFYSGKTDNIGDVDKGNTVTDFMTQEIERGITISSTPVQLKWNKHTINLIDTPGHVDFNYEVERCLTVLDGSIIILDSSAGIEPQTYQVWKQADKFCIPKIIYLNKMDKAKSSLDLCLNDISKLKIDSLVLQKPIYKNDKFIGITDLINLEKNIWDLKQDFNGGVVNTKKIDKSEKDYEEALELKGNLVSKLCEFDDDLAEKFCQTNNLNDLQVDLIINSIRKSTINNLLVPIIVGSSFKKIGVQFLMDSITRYLPSPIEKNKLFWENLNLKSAGFIFKFKFNKFLGNLVFIRVYSGEFKPNTKLYNYSKCKEEKINKIFKVHGNEFIEIKSAKKGDIVALSGLSISSNGDFLVNSYDCYTKVQNYLRNNSSKLSLSQQIILNGFQFPEPVVFCSVESSSRQTEIELESALKILEKEDPSFSVSNDSQTNQTILRGMGDLHLQIIKDRLKKDFKLDPYFGELQIAYLESINNIIENEYQLNKIIKDFKNDVFIKIVLKPSTEEKEVLKVIVNDENELNRLSINHKKLIEKGVKLAFSNGPLLGFPLINIIAELHSFKTTKKTLDFSISSAAHECIKNAFAKNSSFFYLLEPIMEMKIDFLEKDYGSIIKELTIRRAILGDVEAKNDLQSLKLFIPLAETLNISTKLRIITSGNVHFTMRLHNHVPVNKSLEKNIITKFKFGETVNY